MSRHRIAARLLITTTLAACGAGDAVTITQPPPVEDPPGYGNIVATIDDSTYNLHVHYRPSSWPWFSIRGEYKAGNHYPDVTIHLTVFDTTGATPATLDLDGRNAGILYQRYNCCGVVGNNDDIPTWVTTLPGSSGAVLITSWTATGATGTFSFYAGPSLISGARGIAHVSNGRFDITF